MIIEEKKVVMVHYTLTESDASGELIETTEGRDPLGFIFGVGMMIPEFERNLEGLKAGDQFAFAIKAADAYGEYDDTALVEVPKNMFEHEGKIPDGLLEIGNVLPLTDNQGNHLQATVAWVGLDKVKLDFNHPMAGVDLFFSGHVDKVREADPTEIEHGHVHGEGGHHH
jgi:FKBP-type peptidyl-prolyl cis-trans isomerase SlyD